ncbi:MAG: DinB family protein [Candidatus Pristimantibacillus sp.]
MYQTIQSFIADYTYETKSTQKLLDTLTDESLNQEIASGYRDLGFIAWHLVTSTAMASATGLKFETSVGQEEPPASAAIIADTYRATTQSLLQAASEQLKDESLQQSVTLFGKPFTIGSLLSTFVKHEIHHRGQLTILMRQAGLPLAGMYGPSKEEWAATGMDAPQ